MDYLRHIHELLRGMRIADMTVSITLVNNEGKNDRLTTAYGYGVHSVAEDLALKLRRGWHLNTIEVTHAVYKVCQVTAGREGLSFTSGTGSGLYAHGEGKDAYEACAALSYELKDGGEKNVIEETEILSKSIRDFEEYLTTER